MCPILVKEHFKVLEQNKLIVSLQKPLLLYTKDRLPDYYQILNRNSSETFSKNNKTNKVFDIL